MTAGPSQNVAETEFDPLGAGIKGWGQKLDNGEFVGTRAIFSDAVFNTLQ